MADPGVGALAPVSRLWETRPRPADLPNYSNPPIDEVGIGVQFPPIDGLTELRLGLFFSKVRDNYPNSQTIPRMDFPVESLTSDVQGPHLTLTFQSQPPTGRMLLITEDDEHLIQLQNTRFGVNWRRRTNAYPHFDEVHERFWTLLGEFRDYLDAERLKLPAIQQLDVTYSNWISDLSVATFLRPGSSASLPSSLAGPEPEGQDWAGRYLVRRGETPIARLYVQCQSVFRPGPLPNPGPGVLMSLMFRAPTMGEASDDDLADLVATGRDVIVHSFTDITTSEAHQHWGRVQ
jgi:uncharacterized protein (TIGR04255 family)